MQSFMQFLHTVIAGLQPAIHSLRAWFESLPSSPDRWILCAAIVGIALLLIFVPLFRVSGGRVRRRGPFEEVRSYSVLGIGPEPRSGHAVHAVMDDVIHPERTYPRWADAVPFEINERPFAEAGSHPTPIRRSPSVTCKHCGGTLAAGRYFCPDCGYGQSTDRSVTA
jgi:hypothetical protein